MVVLGAAISDRPELLSIKDPVLREFFLFLCCRGVISSFHTKTRSYLSSLKQVGQQADQAVSLVTPALNLPFSKSTLFFRRII